MTPENENGSRGLSTGAGGPLADRRILLLSYGCPPVVGGVERIVADHARWFQRLGARVEVVVGEGRSFEESIPVHRFEVLSSRRGEEFCSPPAFNRMAFEARVADVRSRLEPILARHDTWIIHNILTMPFNLPLTAFLHRTTGSTDARVFAWTHDIAWLDERYRTPDRHPWNLLKRSPQVTAHVAVSGHRKRQLRDLYGPSSPPIRVVHDAVSIGDVLSLDPSMRSLYHRHELHRDDLIALYPARLVRRKNVERALEVTARLRDRGIRVHLIVTAPADPHNPDTERYREQLIQRTRELDLEDSVVFCCREEDPVTGETLELPYDRVSQLYRMADLLLMTSRREGFGMPLIEAGLTGTLIACSRREPLPEIAGDRAIYFDPGEPAGAVAFRIQERLREQTIVGARRRMRQNFTWQSVVEGSILPLFEEFSGTRADPRGIRSN